jgi:hypothetical protein
MGVAIPDVALLSIMLYSLRNLTFENDALNAFQGVLNVHQPRFRRDFLFGMPSSELEFALLWQPGSALLRRVAEDNVDGLFPSWSWVAWKGNVMLPLLGPNRFSRVRWVDAVDTTTNFTSDEWQGAESGEIGEWKIVPDRGNKAPWYFEEKSPTTRFAHLVSETIPRGMQNRRFLKSGSHLLTFYALTALVKSVPGNRSLENGMSDPNAVAPEGVRSYTLQDRFNRFCGVVYLHPQDPAIDTSLLQCIAISRTAYGQHNASSEDPPQNDSDVVSIRDRFAERQQSRKKSEERSASNY